LRVAPNGIGSHTIRGLATVPAAAAGAGIGAPSDADAAHAVSAEAPTAAAHRIRRRIATAWHVGAHLSCRR
jgi:hypothetical protein